MSLRGILASEGLLRTSNSQIRGLVDKFKRDLIRAFPTSLSLKTDKVGIDSAVLGGGFAGKEEKFQAMFQAFFKKVERLGGSAHLSLDPSRGQYRIVVDYRTAK